MLALTVSAVISAFRRSISDGAFTSAIHAPASKQKNFPSVASCARSVVNSANRLFQNQ
jgi:hypothetical protein